MNEIEDIMFAMEQQFEESEADARQEFHSIRDEIKNKVKKTIGLHFSYDKEIDLDCLFSLPS